MGSLNKHPISVPNLSQGVFFIDRSSVWLYCIETSWWSHTPNGCPPFKFLTYNTTGITDLILHSSNIYFLVHKHSQKLPHLKNQFSITWGLKILILQCTTRHDLIAMVTLQKSVLSWATVMSLNFEPVSNRKSSKYCTTASYGSSLPVRKIFR